MLKKLTLSAAATLLVLAFTAPSGASSRRAGSVQELEPRESGSTVLVEKVLDGDTVIVRGWKERVRLANIDAPEMSHGYGKPGQPYSVQASKWLTNQVEGKRVTLKCVDQDRYGRKVCDLFQGDDHVNKALVRAGLAWANTASARYLRDRTVLQAQHEAQGARRGLWASGQPTAPWQWRRECWDKGVCP